MFTTQVWYSRGMTYTWPEQQAPYNVAPNVGIGFSGGGTRALSATMGQLRALISLRLLGNVDYISCVSGGSWASTAFTYYAEGATSDTEFLGVITEPEDIKLRSIETIPTSSMGWGATQDLGDALDAAHDAGVPDDLLWAAAVGQLFFARYGLYDPHNPTYFSLDDATVANIRAANPSLANAPFHTVRQSPDYKMPYLLINATIDGPTAHAPYNPDQLLMNTYSPLYSGIPFQQTMSYPVAKTSGLNPPPVTAVVGGGFIESFAWGCDAPAAPTTNGGSAQVGAPAAPFTLVDASGASSSAFAAILEKIKFLDGLLPEQNYWAPMATAPQTPAQLFDFGDGGNLENYGVIPLLMRGVRKIILFINTSQPLSLTYDPDAPKTYDSDLDSGIPALFGVPVWSHCFFSPPPATDYNQVFPTGDYTALVQEMQALKKAGQPIVLQATHVLQENGYWGVPAGATVEVLYVYLDEVHEWRSQLTDIDLRAELDLRELGMFPHFPNYKTIDENLTPTPGETIIPPWNLTELTPQQVNLLADLTCWVVRNDASKFTGFIA
jgi:hypothetical protein